MSLSATRQQNVSQFFRFSDIFPGCVVTSDRSMRNFPLGGLSLGQSNSVSPALTAGLFYEKMFRSLRNDAANLWCVQTQDFLTKTPSKKISL